MQRPSSGALNAIWAESADDISVAASPLLFRHQGAWSIENQAELRIASSQACVGDASSGDGDGDGACADLDCDDQDPTAIRLDSCGVCGGDETFCRIFADDFESGQTTAGQ